MNLKAELQRMSISDLRGICRDLGVSCPTSKRGIIKRLLEPLKMEYNFCSGWWCSGEGDTIEENTPLVVSDDRKKKHDDRKKKHDDRKKKRGERRKNDKEIRKAESDEKKRLRKQNSDKKKNLIKKYQRKQYNIYINQGHSEEFARVHAKLDAINLQSSLN